MEDWQVRDYGDGGGRREYDDFDEGFMSLVLIFGMDLGFLMGEGFEGF